MNEKQLNWLKSKAGYLKIYQIEKELEMPQGTLKKFVDGERGLSDQWQPKVVDWVNNFRK